MIELTDVAYVRSGVADLDKAVRFATEMVGLELVGPADTGADHSAGRGRRAGSRGQVRPAPRG